MRVAQVLVGVTAQSLSAVVDVVTLPQLRVLVMIAGRGPLNINTVARALGVHPSNATRACDRLVTAGLLDRRDSPTDRRNVSLALTQGGRDLVASMVVQRREAITRVLERMSPAHRSSVEPVMGAFADAAGEGAVVGAWAMGWPST